MLLNAKGLLSSRKFQSKLQPSDNISFYFIFRLSSYGIDVKHHHYNLLNYTWFDLEWRNNNPNTSPIHSHYWARPTILPHKRNTWGIVTYICTSRWGFQAMMNKFRMSPLNKYYMYSFPNKSSVTTNQYLVMALWDCSDTFYISNKCVCTRLDKTKPICNQPSKHPHPQ